MAVNRFVRTNTLCLSTLKQNLNRVKYFTNIAFVFCVVLLCHVKPTLGVDSSECSAVRTGFQIRKINVTDLFQQPTNGRHLRVCPVLDRTCCSEATETRLQINSKQKFDSTVKDSILRISSLLNTRAQRFDDMFRNMLTKSKKDLHEMFKKTYGILYVQNSYVFTDLFQELESYYIKGQVDLSEVMDNFFSLLYQRMFTVINSQYKFDEKYLSCVADHMKDLKPFDDVPQKLSIQIKRSFVASRTFAKALAIGAEVSKNMLSVKPTLECSKSLLRMQYCGGCAGVPQARACSNYCINVMKGCLAYHTNLESEWNAYIIAMDKITDRLLTSFNIENVVEPINIKISEAVMNFQENGQAVSQRVFTGCGKPILGKRRRSINYTPLIQMKTQSDDLDLQFEGSELLERNFVRNRRATNRELKFETLDFNENNPEPSNNKKSGKVVHHNQEKKLEKLIVDIKKVVKDSKKFWNHLPYQICNNEDIAERPSKDEECWNGTAVGKYSHSVVGDGLISQKQNPDVFVDVNKPNAILNEQMYTLKAITNKLKNAYQGMDVEWIDNEEPLSTYTSGSGSGDTTDDTEPDLPDEEGSGHLYNRIPVHEPPVVYPPIDSDLPKIYPNITSNEIPGSSGSGSGSSKTQQMTLTRALITYLFPLVVIWFGGMFAELL